VDARKGDRYRYLQPITPDARCVSMASSLDVTGQRIDGDVVMSTLLACEND
jgi:hypothetical protein